MRENNEIEFRIQTTNRTVEHFQCEKLPSLQNQAVHLGGGKSDTMNFKQNGAQTLDQCNPCLNKVHDETR